VSPRLCSRRTASPPIAPATSSWSPGRPTSGHCSSSASRAAALFFALVSSRYERSSIIVSSNETFSGWAEIFGDPVAVAALVDRLVHHAEVLVLRGDSYRLKGKGKEVLQGDERG
jgi:hypothetical protein